MGNICECNKNQSIDFIQLKRRNIEIEKSESENYDDRKWFELTPNGFRSIPKPAGY